MRYAALILLVAAAAFLCSCGSCPCGRKGEEGADASLPRPDSLVVEIGVNEGSYAVLEPVIMTLTVRNSAGRDLALTFPTAQRYDFIVRKGKQVVWRWSEGMMFAQVIGRATLGAGESISYEVTWEQAGLEGIKPVLGAYSVQGVLKTSQEIMSEEQVFGIMD